jgi:hypothetical protein
MENIDVVLRLCCDTHQYTHTMNLPVYDEKGCPALLGWCIDVLLLKQTVVAKQQSKPECALL